MAGDANADGTVDIADGTTVLNYLFRGGFKPPCDAAADATPDGVVDAGDGVSIWYHLYAGSTELFPLASGVCTKTERDAEPTCGDGLRYAIDAPASISGAGTPAGTVSIRVTTSALNVEAVSIGVSAEGCSIAAARAAGEAADRRDDPPGTRDGGFVRADVVSGGAVAAVAWDLHGDAALPPTSTAVTVLELDVTGAGSTCAPCTLAFSDALAGAGPTVTNVVSASGYAYVPEQVGATFDLCP